MAEQSTIKEISELVPMTNVKPEPEPSIEEKNMNSRNPAYQNIDLLKKIDLDVFSCLRPKKQNKSQTRFSILIETCGGKRAFPSFSPVLMMKANKFFFFKF